MFELPLNLAWERDVGEDAKMLGIAPLRVFTTSPQLRHFMDCSAVSLVKNGPRLHFLSFSIPN